MGMMKDKHGKDLTEVEEVKERWQEYTEELYKKGIHKKKQKVFMTQITMMVWSLTQSQTSWCMKSSGP